MSAEFKVGQVVFVELRTRNELSESTVTKVGRKWIWINCWNRFNKDTMRIDGGGYSSPGKIWISKEEHQAERDRVAVYGKLFGLLMHAQDKYTTEQMLLAIAALHS